MGFDDFEFDDEKMEFDESQEVFFIKENKWDKYKQDNLYVIPQDMVAEFKEEFEVLFIRQHMVKASYYVAKVV